MVGVGQRRGPVVTPRDLEIEAFGIFERSCCEQRLSLATGVDLLIDVRRAVHDDIGDVEDVGIVERRGFRIDPQRIDRAVVEPRAERRAEFPVVGEALVEQRQHLAVEKRLRETALHIASVGAGQCGRRRSPEFLAHLVAEMIHIGAGLDVQPPGHPPVRRQRGHDAVAQALAADAVDDPVGILLEIVARSDPVLHIEFAVGVVDLEILPVGSDVHAARKTVQTYQRVHVETARHGFIVHRLTHETDVSVEFHPFAENIRRGAQVEIVTHQPVCPDDAPLGGIGIGEVTLNQLRARGDRHAVHRRYARPEKLPGVVVCRHAAPGAPTLDPAAHAVAILELGQAERPLKGQIRRERHLLFLRTAALGRDQDDAVGGLAAVQRRHRGPFEDRHALDVSALRFEMPSPPSRLPASAMPPMAE